MISVVFIEANGKEQRIDVKPEGSVMQAAVQNGVDAILADCGGALSCATCHVHVAPEWRERVGPPNEDEAAMLQMAIDPDETSRLSCQIALREELDGVVLHLPKSQF
jgi:2Fe-2S ferredoxin